MEHCKLENQILAKHELFQVTFITENSQDFVTPFAPNPS